MMISPLHDLVNQQCPAIAIEDSSLSKQRPMLRHATGEPSRRTHRSLPVRDLRADLDAYRWDRIDFRAGRAPAVSHRMHFPRIPFGVCTVHQLACSDPIHWPFVRHGHTDLRRIGGSVSGSEQTHCNVRCTVRRPSPNPPPHRQGQCACSPPASCLRQWMSLKRSRPPRIRLSLLAARRLPHRWRPRRRSATCLGEWKAPMHRPPHRAAR